MVNRRRFGITGLVLTAFFSVMPWFTSPSSASGIQRSGMTSYSESYQECELSEEELMMFATSEKPASTAYNQFQNLLTNYPQLSRQEALTLAVGYKPADAAYQQLQNLLTNYPQLNRQDAITFTTSYKPADVAYNQFINLTDNVCNN